MRYLPITLLVIFVTLMAWGAKPRSDWDTEAANRKADYMFLEGQSAYAIEDYGRYIILTKRAYDLDSADIDIAGEWAFIQLANEDGDTLSALGEKAYRLIKQRYFANPHNYHSGTTFANVAGKLGRFADLVQTWEMLDSLFPARNETAMQLARSYLLAYSDGDSAAFDKAMKIYDRLETGTGKTRQSVTSRMMAYALRHDSAAIINEARTLLNSSPENSQIALFVGNTYQWMSKPEQAMEYYDLACRLDSTNGEVYMARADLYNQQGDSVAYDREVFHALRSQSLDIDSKIDIMHSYVSKLYTDPNQEPRIRQLFGELERVNAGEPQIHDLYGAYLFEIKDYRGAIEQYNYAVSLDPNDPSVWVSLVQTAGLADDTASIVKYGTEAMGRYPDNVYFPVVVSAAYRMMGQNDKAIAVIDSFDTSSVRNMIVLSNFLTTKADIYAAVGDTITALEIYDRAIKLDPENAMALNNAAYFTTLTGGDLSKAEDYSARSLANDALNSTYLDTYAWVFYTKGDYNMAKNYIDMAIAQYYGTDSPDSDSPEKSDDRDADETDDDSTSLSSEIYDHAGDIYYMVGEHDQAVEYWKRALTLDPDNQDLQRKVKTKKISAQ